MIFVIFLTVDAISYYTHKINYIVVYYPSYYA